MKRKFLPCLLNRTLALTLFIALFFSKETSAQSGYGDFVFLETFGQADPGDPSQYEFYSSIQNSYGGSVYFRKQPLSQITSLLFYLPSNPPSYYQVPGGSLNFRLNHENNWGPQYRSNAQMGSYSVVTNSRGYRDPYFHEGLDHTADDGELGYMLLVDAYSTTGTYFERDIEGLCAGTKFEFSAWIKDVNTQGSVQPQIRFQIFSVQPNGALGPSLLDYVTESNYPVNSWREQKTIFEMPASVDKIRLRISNAVNQEHGNDIAIDDIGLRPIGPSVNFTVSPQSPVCVGTALTFTAQVESASEAYPTNYFVLQKREGGPSGTWQSVGSYQTSLGTDQVMFILDDVTIADDNDEYRAVVAGDPTTLDNDKCRAVSDPILLQVYNHKPEISVEGGVSTICADESVQLNAVVTGGIGTPMYTYVWEKSTDQSAWQIIDGQTGVNLNTGALIQTTYYRVTAYVGGVGGCAGAGESDILTVTVQAPTVITVQPISPASYCEGGTATLSVAATGEGTLSYEWFKVEGTATALVGTSPSYDTPTDLALGTHTYRVVVSGDGACGSATSDDVMVTVHAPAVITVQPVSPATYCEGGTAALNVAATGEGTLSYEWFKVGPTGDISVGTGSTYETPSDLPAGTHRYYVVVGGSGSCGAVTSEEVIVTINAAEAGSIVGNQEICSGTVPTTIGSVVDGSGVGKITYRWESSTDGQDWNTIADAVDEIYSAPALSQNTFFRRVAISTMDANQCEAYSNVVAITIDRDCSINSEKTVVDANNDGLAQAGEQLTYTIAISNNYDRDITVNIADQIPAHTVYINNKTGGYYAAATNEITWNDLIVPAGASISVSFIVEVTDNLTGISKIQNIAVVTGDEIETPQTPTVDIDTNPAKSFTSSKAADKQSVKAGDELTYTITMTNTGDVDYDGITVADNIPANTTYKEGSASAGVTLNGGTLSWSVDVPFGESREVSFTVVVAEDLTGVESIRNVAKVTGEDPGTPEEPEVETPTDPVKSFTSSKSADKQSVKAGDELTYTITVENTGDVDYDGITVADNIPANTTYKENSASEGGSLSGNTLSWTLDVPFGESREVSFTVVVAEDLTGVESIRNVAKVTGEDPETPEEPQVETPITPGQQFESAKTVKDATGDGNAQAGEELTYGITVRNTGSADYKGITIEDEIPAHTTYVTGSATNGGELENDKLSWSIDVPYGEEVSVTFKVQVIEELNGVDAIRNVATVTGGDPENPEVEHPESPEVPVITGPTANNDNGTTNQGQPITISVLVNDTEGSSPLVPESVRLIDPSTGDKVTTVTITGEGTYTVAIDGTVTFTPDADYVGNSVIKYTVNDENGLESNEGTIAIIVEGVAAEIAPTALDDQASTPYGQAVTITVLSNDQVGSSPIVPSTVRLIDESGNRVSVVTIPGEGRYEVNAQGIVTFEPADGFTGSSSVRYEVADENGLLSNTAVINITVSTRPFKIPNVFTPNGDGKNDVFEIVGIEGFDRVEITVVNRWGNEVYRNNNYRNNWDGQGLNEGTYYYVIITHDGGRQERYAGWVLIKRQ